MFFFAVILLLRIAFCITFEQSLPPIGIQAKITENGINHLEAYVSYKITKDLQNLIAPSYSEKILLGFVEFNVTNVKIMNVHRPSLYIQPVESTGINVTVHDVKPILLGYYIVTVRKLGLDYQGVIEMKSDKITMDFLWLFGKSDDFHPTVSMQSCEGSGDFDISFIGDASGVLNFVTSFRKINKMMKNWIFGKLCSTFKEMVDKSNENLRQIPLTADIGYYHLDMGLVRNPHYLIDHVLTDHRGLIYRGSNKYEEVIPFIAEPMTTYNTTSDKMVYIKISQYFLNTAIFAYFKAGKMDHVFQSYDISKKSKTTLDILKSPSEKRNAYVVSNAITSNWLTVQENLVSFNGDYYIMVQYLENRLEAIVSFKLSLKADVDLRVSHSAIHFSLHQTKNEIELISSKLNDSEDFITQFKSNVIENDIAPQILKQINEVGSEGITIPRTRDIMYRSLDFSLENRAIILNLDFDISLPL